VIYDKFTFVWYSVKQGTTHRPTSHLAHSALSLAWEEHRRQSSWVDFTGHCLWLPLPRLAAVVPLLLPQNSLLTLLAFAPDSEAMWATRISLMASSSSFIYFFLAIARHPQLSALFRLLCMTQHSFRIVYQWACDSEIWTSTVTAKQISSYVVTAVWIPAIRWCQEVFSRLPAVCCMVLRHNTYKLPQHYKRHICRPSCSCKHWYSWVSPIFEHYFCLNCMGTVRH